MVVLYWSAPPHVRYECISSYSGNFFNIHQLLQEGCAIWEEITIKVVIIRIMQIITSIKKVTQIWKQIIITTEIIIRIMEITISIVNIIPMGMIIMTLIGALKEA